jgi:Mg2+/Co2+ transporter CorB
MDTREILTLIIGLIFFMLLVGIRSLKFASSSKTMYELERRAKTKNEAAQKAWQRERILPDILTFRHVLDVLLTVFVILCFVYSLGWLLGIVVSVIALLEAGMLARYSAVAELSRRMYDRYDEHILSAVTYLSPGLKFVRDASDNRPIDFHLHSKEELLHLVHDAKLVLTESERYLLEHSLKFEDRVVSEIMTPRSIVETVEAKEVMGPIVLDRLHKSGHSRFPVIEKDIDHVIGLLYVHDLFSIAKNAKTSTAQKLMESKVFYINENQPLPSALAGFLRVRHHLFIVVNEFEETTGVITIEDVLEALIGRKIVDEFDQYDDLRAVAKRAATLRHKSGSSAHIT